MKKKHKSYIWIGAIVTIILYSIHIIYANKTYQVFILEDIDYNDLLNKYNDIAGSVLSIFFLLLYLMACFMFYINKNKALKGVLNFTLYTLLIFSFSTILEVALNYYRFEFRISLIQFSVSLLGGLIFYFVLYVGHRLKTRFFIKT